MGELSCLVDGEEMWSSILNRRLFVINTCVLVSFI